MNQLFYFGEPSTDKQFERLDDPLTDEYGLDNYFQETINLNVLKDQSKFDAIRDNQQYMFNVYGRSLKSEEGLVNYAHDIRQISNINLIVTIVVNIYSSETIWVKYISSFFMNVHLSQFRFAIYGLSLTVTIVLLIFITIFIKVQVLSPIKEITEICEIMNSNK